MKDLKKIPEFKTEDEEREFWDSHDTTEYFDLENAKKVSFPNLKNNSIDSKKYTKEELKDGVFSKYVGILQDDGTY